MYLTQRWGFVELPLSSIFKYFICNLDTLNIGISNCIYTGPISFLALWAFYVACKVIFIWIYIIQFTYFQCFLTSSSQSFNLPFNYLLIWIIFCWFILHILRQFSVGISRLFWNWYSHCGIRCNDLCVEASLQFHCHLYLRGRDFLDEGEQTEWCLIVSIHSVIHHHEFPIRRSQFQGFIDFEVISVHTFMEIAIIQNHICIIHRRGSPNLQVFIQGQFQWWVALEIRFHLDLDVDDNSYTSLNWLIDHVPTWVEKNIQFLINVHKNLICLILI